MPSLKNPVVRKAVETIYDELCRSECESYDKWSALLWKSSGVDPSTLVDTPISPKWLFAIQTFFAGVVKRTVEREIGLTLSDPFFGWFESSGASPVLDRRLNGDVFGAAYQELYPASARKSLGEFYTPDWLAEHLIQYLVQNIDGTPILDPACGSGVFLLAAIRKLLERKVAAGTVLANIRGFDLNPLAVLMAKANIAMALGVDDETKIPVFLRDSILDEPLPDEVEAFHVVGNPPWLNWDRLPKDYRETTRSLWMRYGLFNLSGNDARHGGAKKELAQLMILRVADCYLKSGGRLAMVLPVHVFQTRKAGEGFRRFRLPDGTPLRVLRVDDFSTMEKNPFGNVGTKAGAILFEKGVKTTYPVEFHRWSNCNHGLQLAEPVNTTPGAPWMIRTKNGVHDAGPSDYQAFLGANTGGANGVFWVEQLGPSENSRHLVRIRNLPQCGKLRLPTVETEIEKEMLYPLLRWSDVERFAVKTPSRFVILPQDVLRRTGLPEEFLREKYPKTFSYLKRFEEPLRQRAAYKKYQAEAPFYSMYNVGRQTVAPIKVVWRRMDKKIRAAVVKPLDHPLLGLRPVVPQETCVLIPCDSIGEANYLVEIMNGNRVDDIVQSLTAVGSKGFGSPGILDHLGIRRFSG